MPCLPNDPEITLLRIYPKEISVGRFVWLSYDDVHGSKIFFRKAPSIEMVRGAGEGLGLLWWAEPVSILLDHTEPSALRSPSEGPKKCTSKWQWCIWWPVFRALFFHFDGSFSGLCLSGYYELGSTFLIYSFELLNTCLGLYSTCGHSHLIELITVLALGL